MSAIYSKSAVKTISGMDKKTKLRIKDSYDKDDIATPDDLAAHEEAMKEYAAGDMIAHDDIDWT